VAARGTRAADGDAGDRLAQQPLARHRRTATGLPRLPEPPFRRTESHPRCKVHRWNRGRQIASSNRCRLTPSVTKIRR
jgi:hypothetical protein